MIDTVRFLISGEITPSDLHGWKKTEGSRLDEERGSIEWINLQHDSSGLRVYGVHGLAQNVEVSLPRVIKPHNGYLLRPDEVNQAYMKAIDLVEHVVPGVSIDKLSRYDLVLHFLGYIWDYMDSLRGLKHKRVRRKCCEFFESSIEWPGKDIKIRLYDKLLEMTGTHGEIQRLEFQLRGKALEDVFSPDCGFHVERLYDQYKRLCGGFTARSVPKVTGVGDLLVLLDRNKVKVSGVDLVGRFMHSLSRSSRYRYQKMLDTHKVEYFSATFNLPESMHEFAFVDCIAAPAEPLAVLAQA